MSDDCPKTCTAIRHEQGYGSLPSCVVLQVYTDLTQFDNGLKDGVGDDECNTCPNGECRWALSVHFNTWGCTSGSYCLRYRVNSGSWTYVPGSVYDRPGYLSTTCDGAADEWYFDVAPCGTQPEELQSGVTFHLDCPCDL